MSPSPATALAVELSPERHALGSVAVTLMTFAFIATFVLFNVLATAHAWAQGCSAG